LYWRRYLAEKEVLKLEGINMSEDDGNHICRDMIKEEPEEPEPQRLRYVTCEVKGWQSLRT
jgi:hypothetical protein